MRGLIREGILFIPFKTWGGKEGIGMIRAQVCDGIRMCVQGRQSQTGHSLLKLLINAEKGIRRGGGRGTRLPTEYLARYF